MFVSAVIPTYNRWHVLPRALKSLFAQAVPMDEVIIVDDGSTDGTAEKLRSEYGDKVRVIVQPNGGVSEARKNGIQAARGEWIAFLDSDDEWADGRNGPLFHAAREVPCDVGWVFGNTQVVDDSQSGWNYFERFSLSVADPYEIFADSFDVQFPIQFGFLQSSLIRRKVLLEMDCFKAGLRSSEDLLTGFQVASRWRFAAIPSLVTRLFRTADLKGSSAELAGVNSADYHLARVISSELALSSTGRRNPWGRMYGESARKLAEMRIAHGQSGARTLATRQLFRDFSTKALIFWCAAMLGDTGMSMWSALRSRYGRSAVARS